MMDDGSYSASGVKPALGRNPNKTKKLNDSPCGPYSHMHGEDGMVGMEGDAEVKTSRGSFHFK